MFFEYFSCFDVKEGFLNYLANVLLFIPSLCFGYCFAFVYLRRVINDDIDSFFSKYSAKKKRLKRSPANMCPPTRKIIINFFGMKEI